MHRHRVGDYLEFERGLFDGGLVQFGRGQPSTRPDPVVAPPERTDGSGAAPGVLEQVDHRIDRTS